MSHRSPSSIIASENKSPPASPARPYTYRTPGQSVCRSFDKESYIHSDLSSHISPTHALIHTTEVTSCNQPETHLNPSLCKSDDGSDTSVTTDSKEGEQNEECEVEVVAIMDESSEVVVVQDGAVESCDIVEKENECEVEVVAREPYSEVRVAQDGAVEFCAVENSSQLPAAGSLKLDQSPKEQHPIDNKSNKSTDEIVPDRQKSAVQAFMSAPTPLAWDDLVRSMREEMLIKTVTINRNKSDESSSIESSGSSGNISTSSMNSSLSSKSSFLRKTRSKLKRRGGPGKRSRKNKKQENLEKKVERVLSDESYPSMTIGGRHSSFTPVGKSLPSIPCSPSTPGSEVERTELASPPIIHRENWNSPPKNSRENWFSQVEKSPTYQSNKEVQEEITFDPVDNPLPLKQSISADSEDSFYYHIRGPDSRIRPKLGSSSKTKGQKNPYAFGKHPMLPAVLEEGHIPPFPTTFDATFDDGEDESVDFEENKDEKIGDNNQQMGPPGSFAASIGQVETNSSLQRLQMYQSSTRTRRRRRLSFGGMLFCCKTNKAEI